MTIKALLLPLLPFALLLPEAHAQQTVVTKRKTVTVETRSSSNLYRTIPRGTAGANAGNRRFKVAAYKPTQHYYTRDGVVSYRYSAQMAFSGAMDASTYLGPHGAVFMPEDNEIPSSASIRSFASLNRRNQPGVGMVPIVRTTTIKKTTQAGSNSATTIASSNLK
jgi:hypothetical protein